MENLKEALEYVVDLKDNEQKIIRNYSSEGKEYYDAKGFILADFVRKL